MSRVRRTVPPAASLATQTLTAPALPDARSVLKPVALEVPALKLHHLEAAPPPRRTGLWIGGVISLSAGTLVALFALHALRQPGSVAPAPAPVATGEASATGEPPQAPSAAPASPPEPVTSPPTHSDPPNPPAQPVGSSAPASASTPSSSGAHPARARSRCVPPYYVDSTGIRRVKRDCFQ